MHVTLALNNSVLIQLFQLTLSYKGLKPTSQGRKVMWVAVDPSRGHKGAVNSTIECFKTSQTFTFMAGIGNEIFMKYTGVQF